MHPLNIEGTTMLPTRVGMTLFERHSVSECTAQNLDNYSFTLLPHLLPDIIPRYSPPLTPPYLPRYPKYVSPSAQKTILLSPNPSFNPSILPRDNQEDVLSPPPRIAPPPDPRKAY